MGGDLPSLDPVAIESLRALEGPDDPHFFADLVGQFVKHADAAIPGIRSAAAKGDAKGVEGLAHGLKGSSGNMGAMRMHGLCAELQKAGSSRSLGGAAATVEALADEYASVRARLLQEAHEGAVPTAPRPPSAGPSDRR